MRYCEDYVISCAIDVWRGNETARVEYKRGEISGVTVGGIDAPERLAEVMQWSSGNYRLVVPEFKLPASAPKRAKSATATPAPVPAPAPSAQAARNASSTKTIFGMPVAEVAKARAAAEAAKAAAKPPHEAALGRTPARGAPRGDAGARGRARAGRAARRAGQRGPDRRPPDDRFARQRHQDHLRRAGARAARGVLARRNARSRAPPPLSADADSARTETAKVDRKTGARKVDVPTPGVVAPAPTRPRPRRPAQRRRRSQLPAQSRATGNRRPRRIQSPRGRTQTARAGRRRRPPRSRPASRRRSLDLRWRRLRVRARPARRLPALRSAWPIEATSNVLSAVVDAYRRTRKPKDIFWNKFVARPLAAVVIVPLARTRRHAQSDHARDAARSSWRGRRCMAVLPGWGCSGRGVAIIEFSYVLDCADGQLARLRGTVLAGRRPSRLLDGRAQGVPAGGRGRGPPLARDREPRWLLDGLRRAGRRGGRHRLTTFMRRPEYAAATGAAASQGGRRLRRGLRARARAARRLAARAVEALGRFIVHYPSYICVRGARQPHRPVSARLRGHERRSTRRALLIARAIARASSGARAS